MIESKELKELQGCIWNELPHTVYTDTFETFDEANGFRTTETIRVPEALMLNDILLWHSMNERNKYSHFEVIGADGFFVCYDGDDTYKVKWNLNVPYLHEQETDVIQFLYELI